LVTYVKTFIAEGFFFTLYIVTQTVKMHMDISVKIILEKPPANVDFGIQKGSGSKYETIQKQKSVGEDLQFAFTITVKIKPEGSADFAGPIVQGNLNGRFIYIDIGTYAGESGSLWGRRLKIPLRGITSAMIEKLSADSGILETKVPGTGKDGGPNCATVKPFSGWYLSKTVINKK
ncbi:MAG: DUF5990 family protein, partial [Ferruginibacter sp.]